jgi:hypothetical protein
VEEGVCFYAICRPGLGSFQAGQFHTGMLNCAWISWSTVDSSKHHILSGIHTTDPTAIQPLNNKSEIEERLELEISQVKDIISQAKFSNSIIQAPEINSEVQGLCATIIDFLVHALHYRKKWGIVKVLGGIIADFMKRFQVFVTKIRGHAFKIETLAQRGYTTILVQSKEVLDGTAQGWLLILTGKHPG